MSKIVATLRARSTFVLPLALVALAGACTNNPVDPHEQEHPEAEGVVLTLNGVEVASAEGEGSGISEGAVTVSVGEETGHVSVVFVDHDGDPIQFDEDVSLAVEVADETIAEFEQDTPGEFGGHVHGLTVGTTSAVFFLMHGDHPDWESEPIAIVVTE